MFTLRLFCEVSAVQRQVHNCALCFLETRNCNFVHTEEGNMDRPSTARGPATGITPGIPKRDILPEEEGPVAPEKTRLPTIFIGSVSGRYTRKIWKRDRDSIRTYYRQSRKLYYGTFPDSDFAIRTIDKYLKKFTKVGFQSVRIIYAGEVKSLGNDDNRLVFDTGRDLSVRGLINFVLGKGMNLDLVIVSLHSFIWADVLGLKMPPGRTVTVYYPQYLLPTNLEDSSLDMFDKTGTKALKTLEFFKATYKT